MERNKSLFKFSLLLNSRMRESKPITEHVPQKKFQASTYSLKYRGESEVFRK